MSSDSVEMKKTEVLANYTAFLELLPSILEEHSGKFAVIRKKEIIAYFDSFNDAETFGDKMYEDNLYSIQKVENSAINLGFYSYA